MPEDRTDQLALPESPEQSTALDRAPDGKFVKGNRASVGKGPKSDLKARVRDFLYDWDGQPTKRSRAHQEAALGDPVQLSRLQELLLSLYEIATDPNNRNAVKAAKLLFERAY